MEETETKVCSKCGIEKLKIHFQLVVEKRKCNPYRKSMCMDCMKIYKKMLYEKNRERYIKRISDYQRKNRNVINKRKRERFQYDIEYRIKCLMRTRFHEMIKRKKADKHYKTSYMLGCSVHECRKWLESKFLPGMTWDNHGEWEIDHITPCASFDLTKPEEQLKCFHYTNLQPLWKIDNQYKSDKIQVLTSEGSFLI